MSKYCKISDLFDGNGKKIAELGFYESDLPADKKAACLADPDKAGWTKIILDKLADAEIITAFEKDAAKLKASK